MSEQFFQLVLLVLAIAVGWLLGRLARRDPAKDDYQGGADSYYKGLNFLLSEPPGAAIQTVINELPVNLNTLQTHLALGNLMRGKGEIEAATRIHQNLLSRPTLPREKLHQVHLELARDYISAGLLDRAERLLRDLADESPGCSEEVLEQLQHIYQAEKEWEQAAAVAQQRLPSQAWFKKVEPGSAAGVKLALSHYCCEMAEQELADKDLRAVRRLVEKAVSHAPSNVRALLLRARLAIEQNRPQAALSDLDNVLSQTHNYADQALPLFRQAFAMIGNKSDYLDALRRLAERTGSSLLHQEVAEQLRLHKGDAVAADYLLEAAQQRNTLSLLSALLDEPKVSETIKLQLVADLLRDFLGKNPAYRCQHCGFSGRKLHWLCPGCEQWGTIAPVRGQQGD